MKNLINYSCIWQHVLAIHTILNTSQQQTKHIRYPEEFYNFVIGDKNTIRFQSKFEKYIIYNIKKSATLGRRFAFFLLRSQRVNGGIIMELNKAIGWLCYMCLSEISDGHSQRLLRNKISNVKRQGKRKQIKFYKTYNKCVNPDLTLYNKHIKVEENTYNFMQSISVRELVSTILKGTDSVE